MITLVTYPPGWNEPSLSPFCVKAMYLLNLAGRDWDRIDAHDPRPFPKGKLPAIEIDGRTIGDSDGIREFLIDRGATFDDHLDAVERADMRAWQRLTEEHLYYQIMLDRWANDAVWPTIQRTYFTAIPRVLRGFVTRKLRKGVLSGLTFMGHLRATETERMARIEQDFLAISARLQRNDFLFGDQPCSADAGLGAMLGAARDAPIDTALKRRIDGDPILSSYADRVAARLGPRKQQAA